jgi:DME family drug/metabolite transporter
MPRIMVLLAAVCFGTTGTAQALGPEGLEPTGVGAARILVGGALLMLVGGAAVRRLPRTPLLIAAAAVAVYQLGFFAAVADTGVAVGTIVAIGSGPAFAGLLEWAVLKTAPTKAWALATALALAGVAVLTTSSADATISLPGVALALLAGAGYATYTLAAKRMVAEHAPETVMAGAFGLGAVLLLPVLALHHDGLTQPGGIALALFLGIVPTALAYVLFARGLKRLSAAETATLTLAEPLTATILGVIVLGESLAPLGACLVLVGLLVLAAPEIRRPARAVTA